MTLISSLLYIFLVLSILWSSVRQPMPNKNLLFDTSKPSLSIKGKKDSPTSFKCQPDYWIYGNLPEDEFIIFAKFIGKRSLIVTVRILRTQDRFSVIWKHEIFFEVYSKIGEDSWPLNRNLKGHFLTRAS